MRLFARVCLAGALLHSVLAGTDAAAKKAQDDINVIPQPLEVVRGKGFCRAGAEPKVVISPGMAEEEYSLSVTKKGIVIKASSEAGKRYALQTLRQLRQGDGRIPVVKINDRPRFRYRGLHLDIVRHYFTPEEVKKYIDIMALHKLNVLHWHLTDDQGWRIEIKSYPLLARKGSYRSETAIGKVRPRRYDGRPYGGFYTQEEVRDIVSYAAANGITVIPEIDLPGHMIAALHAYPSLGCTGGPYEVWTRWGISKNLLCAGNEDTFKFLEAVLTEVMALFPSELVHIGGDECPKDVWKKCPKCQARIASEGLRGDDKFTAEHYLQGYVTRRIESFLASHGRRIIGWDEVLDSGISDRTVIMSWRGSEGGRTAASRGMDAIMTPKDYMYFDYWQTENHSGEPVAVGRFNNTVERVYSYDPTEGLPASEASHILGVQANMWTEFIPDFRHVCHMLLPRLSALSEVQWCAPANKDWTHFRSKMDSMRLLYEEMGVNYAPYLWQ